MRLALSILMLVTMAACAAETPDSETPAPRPPDENAAIEALRLLNQAQADFIRRTRRYALTTQELVDQHLLTEPPTAAATGYDIFMLPSPDAGSYTIKANPLSGTARHFFTDQTGVLRAEADKPATVSSPEI